MKRPMIGLTSLSIIAFLFLVCSSIKGADPPPGWVPVKKKTTGAAGNIANSLYLVKSYLNDSNFYKCVEKSRKINNKSRVYYSETPYAANADTIVHHFFDENEQASIVFFKTPHLDYAKENPWIIAACHCRFERPHLSGPK